jgi:DNA primase
MGCSLSAEQEKLLSRFSHVILFLDGDQAGREAAKEIAARLVHNHFVRVVSPGEGRQPDQMKASEISEALAAV